MSHVANLRPRIGGTQSMKRASGESLGRSAQCQPLQTGNGRCARPLGDQPPRAHSREQIEETLIGRLIVEKA
jgi:hypothetical protein